MFHHSLLIRRQPLQPFSDVDEDDRTDMSMGDSKVITCKAAVCWGPKEPLTIEEIQVEPPRSCEVRVKILCASLCHTDVIFWNAFPIVVEGARTMGANKIIGVDINEKKMEKGKVFGMTDFINPRETDKSISEVIREMTSGLGVDYSFECSGVPSLINEAFEATIPGRGVTIVIGASQVFVVPIDMASLMGGKTIKGSIFGGIKPLSDLPCIVDKCITKELEIEALVTHEVQLEDINHAIELTKQPDCLKVVIHIDQK